VLKQEVLAAVPGVEDVHHVHAWSLTQDRIMVTLHARVSEAAQGDHITSAIKTFLRQRHGIEHATVEIEREACADEIRAC